MENMGGAGEEEGTWSRTSQKKFKKHTCELPKLHSHSKVSTISYNH